jgi:hypothetical protein
LTPYLALKAQRIKIGNNVEDFKEAFIIDIKGQKCSRGNQGFIIYKHTWCVCGGGEHQLLIEGTSAFFT